eukprot:677465-Hanusia_phi.AAC.1
MGVRSRYRAPGRAAPPARGTGYRRGGPGRGTPCHHDRLCGPCRTHESARVTESRVLSGPAA